MQSRPLCIPRQRSAMCRSGFYLTHWGYGGSAQGLGCEAQFLWLQTKPRTEILFFLTDLSWYLASIMSLLNVFSIPFLKPWEQSGLLLLCFHHCGITEGFCWGILKHHFDGIRPCLGMNVVLGEEMWMKGNENWQSKTLKGEELMQWTASARPMRPT